MIFFINIQMRRSIFPQHLKCVDPFLIPYRVYISEPLNPLTANAPYLITFSGHYWQERNLDSNTWMCNVCLLSHYCKLCLFVCLSFLFHFDILKCVITSRSSKFISLILFKTYILSNGLKILRIWKMFGLFWVVC